VSAVPGESPFAALAWVLAASVLAFAQGDLDTPAARVGLALALASFAVAPLLVRRSLAARAVLEGALDRALGAGWRRDLDPALRHRGGLPWGRVLLFPFPFFRGRVRRFRNISYGDAGRHNRLDLYRLRGGVEAAPILIHLHGGRFRHGRKSFEARPLLHRLARRGWICISANYRLQPGATFPDYVVDLKKVIRWAREHAPAHGGDPDRVIVAGSSAGAHIAATAALTAGDPTFQPGFEDADTSVSAAVGLYGYYGPVDSTRQPLPSSPADYAHPDAPPLLIAHGSLDTYVPAEHARRFADRAREASTAPVVYAELPGAQHSFDVLHSIRFELLIDAVEDFAAWVLRPPQARERGEPRRIRSTTGLSRSAVVQPPTV
jgi:acetyl esterase/lipase